MAGLKLNLMNCYIASESVPLQQQKSYRKFQWLVILVLVTLSVFIYTEKLHIPQLYLVWSNYSSLLQSTYIGCSRTLYVGQKNMSNYQQVWVGCNAPYPARLILYNQVIMHHRQNMLNHNKRKTWPTMPVKYIFTSEKDHLQMDKIRGGSSVITTIFLDYLGPPLNLNWTFRSFLARSSYIEATLYDWEALSPVCQWMRDYVNYTGDKPCFNSSLSTRKSQPTEFFDLNLVKFQMSGGLNKPYVSFIHLIKMASVTFQGEVYTSDVKIYLPSCITNVSPYPPYFDPTKVFDEIFVISQSLGLMYFHKMMENIPRMMPYLSFLRQNPQIRIHTMFQDSHTDGLFRALRLDPRRIVTGMTHGKLVYLPQSTGCQQPMMNDLQILSREYQSYISMHVIGNKTWNSVLLIKRTQTRQFNQQSDIENIVHELSTFYGFRYELFSDDPPMTIEETMSMFFRARVIVAPHGAGLSNTLFCRPNTRIIEVACAEKPMCFLVAAYQLGHRYFGIPAKLNSDCTKYGIDVNITDIQTVLKRFLVEIRSLT